MRQNKRVAGLGRLLDGLYATPVPCGKYAAEVKFTGLKGTCTLVEYWSTLTDGGVELSVVVSPVEMSSFREAVVHDYVENRFHAGPGQYLAPGNYILTQDKCQLDEVRALIGRSEK
jgi:hypothetical protein